ncbi:MAG: alpha-glucan family phosphorylase, partial [Acidimicrobiaceae bacterium]|nr:alpha-glucan family phosphorylase [Acidimicrobiaceae bacterium]
ALLLSQPDRLKALLLDEHRPLQLVFAGKAHPADDLGKAIISQIARFSQDPLVRHRITFVVDYDIALARILYQGSDVWLNTPRRPMEASGTSGEKAALNGALNCSILDGWWDEMFDQDNGWAITSAESRPDLDQRDAVEANSLFDILERQIIPLFYDRRGGRYPREWARRVKASMRSLGPRVQASRMVRDYVEGIYEPLAAQHDALSASSYARARALAAWRDRVVAAWPGVRVVSVDKEEGAPLENLGDVRHVSADVDLGTLSTDDVVVQVVHGPVGSGDELTSSSVVPLSLADSAPSRDSAHEMGAGGHTFRYEGSFTCEPAGRHGYTVRVLPAHADLSQPMELGCVTWA